MNHRELLKGGLGINKAEGKKSCSSCFYRPTEGICNKHFLKTNDDEVCKLHKKDTKFVFFNGGTMSPR